MTLALSEEDLALLSVRRVPIRRHLGEFAGLEMIPAKSLDDLLRAELDDGEGTDEYRAWVLRAALRHHLVPT